MNNRKTSNQINSHIFRRSNRSTSNTRQHEQQEH